MVSTIKILIRTKDLQTKISFKRETSKFDTESAGTVQIKFPIVCSIIGRFQGNKECAFSYLDHIFE